MIFLVHAHQSSESFNSFNFQLQKFNGVYTRNITGKKKNKQSRSSKTATEISANFRKLYPCTAYYNGNRNFSKLQEIPRVTVLLQSARE